MNRSSRRAAALLPLSALLLAPLPASAEDVAAPGGAPAAAVAEAKRPAIENFTLANGLQVVVLPDHRAPLATQMIWYRVGSADEMRGHSGVAHFLEHLMFKGTKAHADGEFSRAVAAIGGEDNAFTSYDYTAYYQQVPVEALEQMMEFESDRMENLVLTDAQVLPERDVILEERRMRTDNSPEGQLGEALDAALFQNHPYGTPVIGWQSEMEKLSRGDEIAFYETYYTPNNATLLIAGDVTVDEVRALAEKTFGRVPRRAEPGTRVRPKEPEPLAARTVTLTDGRVTQPSVQTTWLVPSDHTAGSGESEAFDLLADILGGGTTSRLYRALVVQQGIAAGVGAYYQGTALDEGQFTTYGSPRGNATVEDVDKAIDAEVARIARDGVPLSELETAKARVRKALIYARDNQTEMAQRYGAALSTGSTVAEIESWPERIDAVKADEVRQVAARYLLKKRSVKGYLLPQAETPETAAAEPGTPAEAPQPSLAEPSSALAR